MMMNSTSSFNFGGTSNSWPIGTNTTAFTNTSNNGNYNNSSDDEELAIEDGGDDNEPSSPRAEGPRGENWVAHPQEAQLTRNKAMFTSVLSALKKNDPLVTIVDLNDARVTDAQAQELAKLLIGNEQLLELQFVGHVMHAAGATAIAECVRSSKSIRRVSLNTAISTIEVSGCKALAEALLSCPSIRNLDLSGNSIGDSGAEYFGAAIASVRFAVRFVLLPLTTNPPSIHSLCFNQIQPPDGGGLSNFYIGRNRVGNKGVRQLSRALSKNSTLTYLDLSLNVVGREGCEVSRCVV